MICKFDDEMIKLLALSIGTARDHPEIEEHYLMYLVCKLLGRDGLSLDSENTEIYCRLKALINKYSEVLE